MLNGLSLFSGIGGIDVALSKWVRPIAYCEIEPYCQGVLLSRMAENKLHMAPIWNNITSLQGWQFIGLVDIVFGGFPCQDISVAGLGRGLEGERSGLFYEILRLCRQIRPSYIFLENVPAITSRGGRDVVREITALGYDCRWCVISAASIGALHRRERWFLLAHSKHNGTSTSEDGESFEKKHVSGINQHKEDSRKIERTSSISSDVANSKRERLEGYGQPRQQEISKSRDKSVKHDGNTNSQPSEQANSSTESIKSQGRTRRGSSGQHWPFESRKHWQETVSGVCRTSDGVPFQVERLKSLGNSVVSIQVKEAFQILMGLK